MTKKEKNEELLTPLLAPLGYKLFEIKGVLDFVRITYTPNLQGGTVRIWHIVVPDFIEDFVFSIYSFWSLGVGSTNQECAIKVRSIDACIRFIEENMNEYDGLKPVKNVMEI